MTNKEIQEIIITLIQSKSFFIGETNEETATEIAKFEKAYFNEIEKQNNDVDVNVDVIDTSAIIM